VTVREFLTMEQAEVLTTIGRPRVE
jgi:hypothetical protein